MDHRQQYRQAQLDLIDVVKDLKDEDLDRPSTCEGWTIRDVLKHVVENAYRAAAGDFDPGTDTRLDNDPRQEYPLAAEAAWQVNQRNEVLEGTMEFAGAERPKWMAISFQFADTFIHIWDIRRGLSQPVTLRPDLVEEALKIADMIPDVDDFRGPGKGFGYIVPIDSDDPQDKLLSLTGRDPQWTP